MISSRPPSWAPFFVFFLFSLCAFSKFNLREGLAIEPKVFNSMKIPKFLSLVDPSDGSVSRTGANPCPSGFFDPVMSPLLSSPP